MKQLNIDIIGITSLVLPSDVRAQTIIPPWVLVIDDTGLMGNEIANVKSFVQTLITAVEAAGETPEYFVLTQFDDPVHFANSYSTSASFISALNNSVVSGGDDCIEYGVSGIEAALQFIKASSDTDTNWFNLADTSGCLYWINQVSGFAISIEISGDFLSSLFITAIGIVVVVLFASARLICLHFVNVVC